MTIQSASEVKFQYEDQYKAQEQKAPASVFTDPRANTAQGTQAAGQTTDASSSATQKSSDDKNKIKERQKYVEDLAKEYNLELKDLEKFVLDVLGYDTNKLYSLEEEEFTNIIAKFLPSALELLSEKYKTIDKEKLFALIPQYKQLRENGSSYDEMAEFVCHFGDDDLLKIINKETGKSYKSISQISDEELDTIVKQLAKKYLSSSTDPAKRQENTKFIMNILGSLKKVSNDDYKRLYNAFLKAAPEVDKNCAVLMKIIDYLKKNPQELDNFINKGLSDICIQNGLDYDKVKPAILKIINVMKDGGLDNIENLNKLLKSLNPEEKYAQYQERIKNGEKLSDKEMEFVTKFEKISQIKQKQAKGEALTEEEQAYIDEFNKKFGEKLNGIWDGFYAALSGLDPEKFQELMEQNNIDPQRLQEIFEKIFDLQNYDPNFKIDKDFLDKLTNGAFSDYMTSHPDIVSGSNVSSSSDSFGRDTGSGDYGFGFGFSNSSEPAYTSALNNLAEMRMGITQTDTPTQFTLSGTSEPSTPKLFIPAQAGRSQANFAASVQEIGLVPTLINVGKDFSKACSTAKYQFDHYMDGIKRKTDKINFMNICGGNSALNNRYVERYRLYNDEKSMKKLQASIGDKQIYEHLREQQTDNKEKEKKNFAV